MGLAIGGTYETCGIGNGANFLADILSDIHISLDPLDNQSLPIYSVVQVLCIMPDPTPRPSIVDFGRDKASTWHQWFAVQTLMLDDGVVVTERVPHAVSAAFIINPHARSLRTKAAQSTEPVFREKLASGSRFGPFSPR